jgi:hypothetical protein
MTVVMANVTMTGLFKPLPERRRVAKYVSMDLAFLFSLLPDGCGYGSAPKHDGSRKKDGELDVDGAVAHEDEQRHDDTDGSDDHRENAHSLGTILRRKESDEEPQANARPDQNNEKYGPYCEMHSVSPFMPIVFHRFVVQCAVLFPHNLFSNTIRLFFCKATCD